MAVGPQMAGSHPLPADEGIEQAAEEEEQVANGRTDVYEITIPQAQELVARMTAVRGALQDHLEDNPVIYSGVAALLDFTAQICRKLKSTVLGAGSGDLQMLLVQEVGQRLHEVDIARHFTPTSFEAKIKQMNGYQSHIVSPEKAVTALISDAFSDCAPIAQWMVVAVRAFLSKSAKECADEVVERDPDKRQQLADLIVQGMEEVFNEWEKEAAALAEEIMAMEKTIVSPVFFQRLALKRRQRELGGFDTEQQKGIKGMANQVRASGAGLLARLRGKKSEGGGSASGRRAPSSSVGGDDDAQSRSSAPSFAGRRRAPNAPTRDVNFTPAPARNLRFVRHIKSWDTVKKVILKDSQSQFELMSGKFYKKAHSTGIQAAVTKSWSSRFFIFDVANCDLFYWKDEPTAEFIEANAEQEYIKATRVAMPKSRLEQPTKDEMKGFNGSETCGVRIANAHVKGRFDVVTLGFASDRERALFVQTVSQSLAPPEPEPEAEEPAPEEPEPEEQTDGAGDDEDADAYGGYREDEGQGGDEGEEGEEGDDFEDDGMPDSPTNAYRPGGLGVGSHFFNADDLKDKAGNKILTGEIVIPSRWRTRSRSADEPDTGGITTRIEGTDALMWLTSDMNMYVTIVKDTMAATLPKMAVSVLLQRIIANDMLRRLQKMALGWEHAVADDQTPDTAKTLHSTDITQDALRDLEAAMTEVRMATSFATMTQNREKKKASEVRCAVPINALALAGHARLLAAAQQPSPETILQDEYGPLFPFKALECSDTAAKRWQAVEDFDRTAPAINIAADPLAPPAGSMSAADAAQREQDAETDALRGGTRSGMAAGVTSSVVDFASRMRDGMTGRRRVTDQDVEEERRTISSQPQPLAAPQRAPARRTPAPAANAADTGEDALAAPPPAPAAPVSNDPLGGGGGLGPALGFGTDPLSAPRQAAPPQSNGRRQTDDYSDEDTESVPLQRAAQQQAAAAPQRAPPRAPAPGAAPQRAPPRRAPPAPGGGAAPPRVAPPAPGIGRPGPLRAAPGRPAPAAAGRPAPARPAPTRDNLPL